MAQKAVKLCVDLLSKAVNYRWDQKRVLKSYYIKIVFNIMNTYIQ